jgi:hypothetical protein
VFNQTLFKLRFRTDEEEEEEIFHSRFNLLYISFYSIFFVFFFSLLSFCQMDINQSTGNKMPSQEHINFINKLNDAKIPRQSQLIANRLFMKNFPREVKKIRNN